MYIPDFYEFPVDALSTLLAIYFFRVLFEVSFLNHHSHIFCDLVMFVSQLLFAAHIERYFKYIASYMIKTKP